MPKSPLAVDVDFKRDAVVWAAVTLLESLLDLAEKNPFISSALTRDPVRSHVKNFQTARADWRKAADRFIAHGHHSPAAGDPTESR